MCVCNIKLLCFIVKYKKISAILMALLCSIVGIVSVYFDNKIISCLFIVLSFFVTIGSICIPTTYKKHVKKNDWVRDETTGKYTLTIPAKEHGFGKNCKAELYVCDKKGAFRAPCSDFVTIDNDGNVMYSGFPNPIECNVTIQ